MPPPAPSRPVAASSLNTLFSHLALRPSRPQPATKPTTTAIRTLSATAPRATKTFKSHLLPSRLIPPYPYGERRLYKQSNRGLYGSARIRFGNIVAPRHRNKSPTFWRPNLHVKNFACPALGGSRVKTRLTLRVLKTIRREGGLENYLLKSKPARIKELGPGGWNLRWLLMQTRAVQERFNDERVRLGLEPREIQDRDHLVRYALDFATPGPLSLRSQGTLDELKSLSQAAMNGFVLGDADLAAADEPVEELSDEAEEQLLGGVGETDAVGQEAKTAKDGAEA